MPTKTSTKIKKVKSSVEPEKPHAKERYFEAVGRRKTAIARVRIWPLKDKLEVAINEKPLDQYFSWKDFQDIVLVPLHKLGNLSWKISVKVKGSGLHAQAVAARHGLSRALILADPESRKVLKTAGFLTRDQRMRERKKFGLKGARRAPQWSKR